MLTTIEQAARLHQATTPVRLQRRVLVRAARTAIQATWTSQAILRAASKLLGLLALTTCHVTMMIAAKNGATTTVTTVMTTGRKARRPSNFITTDQITSRLKLSRVLIFF
jgi:hypothetical protein